MSDDLPSDLQQNIHQYGLSAAWNILLNVSILCVQFKYDKGAYLTHVVLGYIIFLATYGFILQILAPFSFNVTLQDEAPILLYVHGIIGCALLGLVFIQVFGGLYTRLYQQNFLSKISRLQTFKKAHKILGYFLAVLYKIDTLWAWYPGNVFIFLCCWQFVSILLLLCFKMWPSKLEGEIIDKQKSEYQCFEVGRMSEIQGKMQQYIIFANYIYDLGDLKKNHPGGHEVIQSIKGRQVDRFLYGMYSSELFPDLLPYSHSSLSLKLVGLPRAKLVIPSPYTQFKHELQNVDINFIQVISKKTMIYVLGLVPTTSSTSFRFSGYTDLRQLGQYYSVSVKGWTTRLYTAVNFLSDSNVQLMKKIIIGLPQSQQQKRNESKSKQKRESQLAAIDLKDMLMNKTIEPTSDNREYLPIMLKIYENGKFTSALYRKNFNGISLTISSPKGRGLELETTKAGTVIIVAGGTGLFPFSDIIDLIYKQQLILNNHEEFREILEHNPILSSKPFQKYRFIFMISVGEPEDMHPITLHQLISISYHKSKCKVILRVSKNEAAISKIKSEIQFTKDYFTKRILDESKIENLSRIWICGPPKLNTDISKTLLQNGLKRQDFVLL